MEILIDHPRFLKSVWYRHLISRSLTGVAPDDNGLGRVSIDFTHDADGHCCTVDPGMERFGEWLGDELKWKRGIGVRTSNPVQARYNAAVLVGERGPEVFVPLGGTEAAS
jgi:hypothetical protein